MFPLNTHNMDYISLSDIREKLLNLITHSLLIDTQVTCPISNPPDS